MNPRREWAQLADIPRRLWPPCKQAAVGRRPTAPAGRGVPVERRARWRKVMLPHHLIGDGIGSLAQRLVPVTVALVVLAPAIICALVRSRCVVYRLVLFTNTQ